MVRHGHKWQAWSLDTVILTVIACGYVPPYGDFHGDFLTHLLVVLPRAYDHLGRAVLRVRECELVAVGRGRQLELDVVRPDRVCIPDLPIQIEEPLVARLIGERDACRPSVYLRRTPPECLHRAAYGIPGQVDEVA